MQIEVNNEPVILKESNDLWDDMLQETPKLLDCGNWPIVRSSNIVDNLIKLGPVSRWKTLSDHVKILYLKKLCDTRWEAKISSVKAVRYQVGDIPDALIGLSGIERCNHETAHEAITLKSN